MDHVCGPPMGGTRLTKLFFGYVIAVYINKLLTILDW